MVDFSQLASLDWRSPEGWPRPIGLASLAVAGLVSLLIAWLVDDSGTDLAMAKQQFTQVAARHKSLQQQSRQVEEMQAHVQALKSSIGEGSQQYLRPDELPDVLHLFSTLSLAREVELIALEVGNARQAGRIELQPIELLLGGTYHNISDLHASVARWPWLVIVQAFEANARETDHALLDMRVSVFMPLLIDEASR